MTLDLIVAGTRIECTVQKCRCRKSTATRLYFGADFAFRAIRPSRARRPPGGVVFRPFCARGPQDPPMFFKIRIGDIEIGPKSIYVHMSWRSPDRVPAKSVKFAQKSSKLQHFANFANLFRHESSCIITKISTTCKIFNFKW